MAIWLITSQKKGVASTTLARDIGVTQKTAWFMLHRLRHAARTQSFHGPLDGEVEIDETYVGGKAANRHKGDPKNGPGTSGKTAVIGALKRGGNAVAMVIRSTDTATLDPLRSCLCVAVCDTDFDRRTQRLPQLGPDV